MSTKTTGSRARPRRWPLLAGLAAALTVVCGCTIPTAQDDAAPAPSPAAPVAVEPSAEATAPPEPEQPAPERFAQSFASFSEGLGGVVGIAVAPVGDSAGGDPAVQVAGEWSSGAAWSTIKVPLAIAALNESDGDSGLESAASSAITVSDNAAAEQLWASLGSDDEAALAVEGVLQQFGDLSTVVPSARARPEFSIFGQTAWSLSEQARFASALPCEPTAAEAYALMGQVSGDQSWGLGALAGAHFKGGWGPGLSDGYLVRQLGVIDTATGQLAVAIAAETPGSFADGTALLSQVGQWIAANPAVLPLGGSC